MYVVLAADTSVGPVAGFCSKWPSEGGGNSAGCMGKTASFLLGTFMNPSFCLALPM